jgi:DNA-binding winged helix-turn-helix (wHTH) protein
LAERYEFGDFYLDVRERRLERGKTPVHLEPKAFELLVYLVTHAGSLVEKEELLAGPSVSACG